MPTMPLVSLMPTILLGGRVSAQEVTGRRGCTSTGHPDEKIFPDCCSRDQRHAADSGFIQSWSVHQPANPDPSAGILWPSLLPAGLLLRPVWIRFLRPALLEASILGTRPLVVSLKTGRAGQPPSRFRQPPALSMFH